MRQNNPSEFTLGSSFMAQMSLARGVTVIKSLYLRLTLVGSPEMMELMIGPAVLMKLAGCSVDRATVLPGRLASPKLDDSRSPRPNTQNLLPNIACNPAMKVDLPPPGGPYSHIAVS